MHARSKILPYRMWHDSAIFIPKMTHITLSSDNKVNLLKPFCRWVWRFFIQVIEMHGPYILKWLSYISAQWKHVWHVYSGTRHKRITVTRQNRWRLSSEASVTWPPSGFLIVQELEMSPIIPEMDGFQWRFFFLRFPTALPNYWPLKRASPYTLF